MQALDFERFETMLRYEPVITERVILSACYQLDKPMQAFLEDVGTWLVTNADSVSIRRLLRFGGADFREFLDTLDELPGRIQMALPGAERPANQPAAERPIAGRTDHELAAHQLVRRIRRRDPGNGR